MCKKNTIRASSFAINVSLAFTNSRAKLRFMFFFSPPPLKNSIRRRCWVRPLIIVHNNTRPVGDCCMHKYGQAEWNAKCNEHERAHSKKRRGNNDRATKAEKATSAPRAPV